MSIASAFHIFTALSLLALAGCSSKVSTELDKASEQLVASALPAPSSVELLESVDAGAAPTCSPQNKFRLLVTENSSREIKCRDLTKLDAGLTLGPICPGGVVISAINSSDQWVDCSDVKVCGQSPSSVNDLASNPLSPIQQRNYSGLPWGCAGVIEWAFADEINSVDKIKRLEVSFKPPACPPCSQTGVPTCEVCGVDAVKPVIQEVLAEVASCNKIRVLVFAEDKESGLHRDAYSFDGGVTWQSSSEFVVTTMSLTLASDKIRVRDRAGNIALGTRNISKQSPPCPCDAPWGERIPDGESRTTFKVGSVQCNQTCSDQSINRTCTNGVLSGDASFSFNSCNIEGCPQCTLPWGEKISHGQSVTAYENSSVTCADQCKSSVLKCERGVLVGDIAKFKYKACAFSKPTCNCSFAGTVIPDGTSKAVFAKSEPACGETCTEGKVTCSQGTLSGNTTMTNLSCTLKECKCTTSWGQKLDLNEEISAYKQDTLTCSQSITCDDPSNMAKIKCANTTTNQLVLTQGTGALADYKSASCSSPVCACVHLGVVFKPGGPALKVYKVATSVPPATCSSAGNYGSVTCVQSGNNFIKQGDTNTSVFGFTQCQDPPGGGTSTETIGAGTGGGTGGGVGNDSGEGEGFRLRLTGGGGSGCDVNSSPYVCGNYSYRTTLDYGGACYMPGPEGPRAWPADITNVTERVALGTFVAAYSRKTVTCTDSCSNYASYIVCGRAGWYNIDKFPYQSCQEVCP